MSRGSLLNFCVTHYMPFDYIWASSATVSAGCCMVLKSVRTRKRPIQRLLRMIYMGEKPTMRNKEF